MKSSAEPSNALKANGQQSPPTSHRVVTFYSYKGGVGRSMAVANIALLLARDHGLKVLAVDWDLEAPGLHRYFNMADENLGDGVIDYLQGYKEMVRSPQREIRPDDLSIRKYIRQLDTFIGGGSLNLLGAGSQQNKSKYVDKVRGFDWGEFYREWNGAQLIEGLRREFLDFADVTLIDSRTGITDVGGVCTVQLPDTVVFVFVFNEQNLSGIEQIAGELGDDKNPALAALRRKPELLFLPCRKELTELERLRHWETDATKRFTKFCDTPKIHTIYGDVGTYLRKASVPYIPYFAYGEELAAKSEKGIELAEAFQPLIGLLVGERGISPAVMKDKWMTRRRRIEVYSGAAIVSAIAAISFFLVRSSARDWLFSSAKNALDARWESVVVGALGGMLGAATSVLLRFQNIAKEDPWKLSFKSLVASLVLNMLGGCLLGVGASLLLPENRYNVVGAVAAGFLWRSVVQVTDSVSHGERLSK